jgi:hypothetical protein
MLTVVVLVTVWLLGVYPVLWLLRRLEGETPSGEGLMLEACAWPVFAMGGLALAVGILILEVEAALSLHRPR